MGLLFPPPWPTTTRDRGLGAPAVEPNPHAVSSPVSGRPTESPPRRFIPRIRSSKRRRRTPSSPSASGRRPGPNLASPPPPPVARATAELTTCGSCLVGPVVTDPDSGVLVCTSCGLVHDLGFAEFMHTFAQEVGHLVMHTFADEPVAELTCWPDSDSDSGALVCTCDLDVGAGECADLALPSRIARPPRSVEQEAAGENKVI